MTVPLVAAFSASCSTKPTAAPRPATSGASAARVTTGAGGGCRRGLRDGAGHHRRDDGCGGRQCGTATTRRPRARCRCGMGHGAASGSANGSGCGGQPPRRRCPQRREGTLPTNIPARLLQDLCRISNCRLQRLAGSAPRGRGQAHPRPGMFVAIVIHRQEVSPMNAVSAVGAPLSPRSRD